MRARSSKARSSSTETAFAKLSIGRACSNGANRSEAAAPTRCVGESGVLQLRMLALQFDQLAQQRVELGVGDRRIVEHVVTVVRLFDLRA